MENKNLIQDYVAYFRRLAEAHKDIKDFVYIDYAQLEGRSTKGELQSPVLMVDTVKGHFTDPNVDAPVSWLEGGFAVLYHCGIEQYEDELQALDDSQRIGLEILNRMEADLYADRATFLKGYSRPHVKWEAIGPVADGLFGVIFNFKVVVDEPEIRPAAEIWSDLNNGVIESRRNTGQTPSIEP